MKRYLNLYLLLSAFHYCICVDLIYNIQEGQNEGTFLGNIAADIDVKNKMQIKEDMEITFHLVKQTIPENFQLFQVGKTTGKLYTAQSLNAESLCKHRSKECSKIIEVVVRSSKLFITVLEIKVIIQDINEYPPQFPEKQINIQFSEDVIPGTEVSIPNAKDNDVGLLNSQITYEFKKTKNEPFILHASQNVAGTFDLSIKLEKRLDREVEDSYMVQVIAKDGGTPPKQSALNVYITVTDVNDNFPIFTQSVYNVSISNEHDAATPVLTLSAKDKDTGINGKISYFISSDTSERVQNLFKVDEVSGEIFINKNLPIKNKSVNKLYVKARDGGTSPLSSVAMVLINVINEQNNAPTIDVKSILMSQENVFRVSEDTSIGSFIAYVKVTDHDTGDNGEVVCDLQHGKFQLQNISTKKYKLTIKNPLDREIEDHHDITISCQDKGFPPLHTDYHLSVYVEDVNDVPPTPLKETFKFFVDENKEPNMTVGFINATDPDLGDGGKLTYSMLTHHVNFLPFRVTDQGFITTLIRLDHELQETYKFQVLIRDHGTHSLESMVTVIVEVMDENDNAPFFTFPSVDSSHKMDVLYYPHHPKNITILKASDHDSRENAFLKYEIKRGNEKQLFFIDRYSGCLSSAHTLRKEDAGSYELEFVVQDSGSPALSATMTLFLRLRVDNRTTTSEMANSVQIQDDDKMQVKLVITITIVAVIISIVITASISVCVLRCNAQSHDLNPYNDLSPSKQQCFQDPGYLVYPTYQSTTWPGIYMTIDKSANGRAAGLPREICQGFECTNGQNGSALMVQPWVPADIACQMCVPDVTTAPNCENDENTTMMREDFSWISTMSAHAENGQSEEGTDIFTPRSPPASDKLQDTERKPIQETFSYSGDTNTPTKSFYKTIIDQSTLHKERTKQELATTDNGASNIISESKTLPMNSNSFGTSSRPLPPVPNKQI